MANYTAADVKKLRETTGSGMLDCKKALDCLLYTSPSPRDRG